MQSKTKANIFPIVILGFLAFLPQIRSAQYPQPSAERVYAIKAGKLVGPEKGTTEANQIVLVRGKKIEAVGPNVTIPSDAKVIDL